MELTRRDFALAAASTALLAVPGSARAAGPPVEKMPPFGLGLVTYNLARDWDLATALRVCRDVGVSALEARTTHKHGIEPSLTPGERREVRKRFEDAGVVFWGCGTACEFHAPDRSAVERNVEECKRFVALTAELGGRMVKVRPNGLSASVPEEKTLEQIGKALVPCGRAAADAGVEICVEVHGPGTAHPPRMRAIMDHCGHPAVGVTWNSNPTDLIEGGIEAGFALLKPFIKSCHVTELYRQHAGAYPYRTLFRLLREAGYDRYTLAELGRPAGNPEEGAELLRYYRSLWLELAGG